MKEKKPQRQDKIEQKDEVFEDDDVAIDVRCTCSERDGQKAEVDEILSIYQNPEHR